MSDVGFLPAIRRLLSQTPKRRQTALFSATLGGPVAALIDDHQRSPQVVRVAAQASEGSGATHVALPVEQLKRTEATADIVSAAGPTIVFCRTRHRADRVARQLAKFGVEALPIHGGRSQAQRSKALGALHDGRIQALVATDVAARGIHVDDLACVVHYDPAEDEETYVHRSGRTGRAGATGVVVSLVEPSAVRSGRLRRSPAPRDVRVEVVEPADLLGRVRAGAPERGAPRPTRPATSARTASSGNTLGRSASTRSGRPGPKRQQSDRPRSDRSRSDRSQSDRSQSDRAQSDRSRSGGPRSGGPRSGRPRSGANGSGGTRSGRVGSDRAGSGRAGSGRPSSRPKRAPAGGAGRRGGGR
jgi:superfamily II DNA/RNA helicase